MFIIYLPKPGKAGCGEVKIPIYRETKQAFISLNIEYRIMNIEL
jgi:hypothetical protein